MVDSAEKQPFLSHLEELRKRLVVCAIGVGAGFVIAYIFAERLFQLLVAPLKAVMPEGDQLISPTCLRCFLPISRWPLLQVSWLPLL